VKKLFLIGFMGVGKTTVAQMVAQRLAVPFIDLDCEIERVAQRSISDIFSEYGEEYFRDLETQVLIQQQACSDAVVSTGGGIIGRDKNWQIMRTMGTVCYLHASWETLVSRLVDTSNRPLADNGVDRNLMKLWQSRLPLYRQADVIIDTDGLSAEQVVTEILNNFKVD